MARVLVTGGTGELGRKLVPRLLDAGHTVRVLSRRPRPQRPGAPDVEWAEGDLASGVGLGAAVVGADVVVHAATAGRTMRNLRATDVEGTRRLGEAARAAGTAHLLYVSIVGVDRHPLPYYRLKREAERVVESSGAPWTVFRATQFHELLDVFCRAASPPGFTVVGRGFVFQPVDTDDVAARIVELVGAPPAGRAPDLGGPEVRGMDDLARAWRRARGRGGPVVPVPLPGRIARAFREGVHTCPEQADGTRTFEDWLADRYGRVGVTA